MTTYTLPSIGPSHQLQGLVARNGLGFAKRPHLYKPGSRGAPLTVGASCAPRSCDMLCFPFSFPGESHALVCGSRSHTLIPTGARSRPAALPKPIIISVPKPHCWKGSASKPYVELPPHTAPLGMEVGPAQACAVKVVVQYTKKRKKRKAIIHRAHPPIYSTTGPGFLLGCLRTPSGSSRA